MMKRKWIGLILVVGCLVFCRVDRVYATLAGSKFASGLISYTISSAGSYETTITNAASAWNTKIKANSLSNKVYLSKKNSADVHVSFTATAPNYTQLGYCSMYYTDIYGDIHIVGDISNVATVTSAFMYVYPTNISIQIQLNDPSSNTFNFDDCLMKTTVHEFGHILGLSHPTGGVKDSVMVQGLSNVYTPYTYDINDLRKQWN